MMFCCMVGIVGFLEELLFCVEEVMCRDGKVVSKVEIGLKMLMWCWCW